MDIMWHGKKLLLQESEREGNNVIITVNFSVGRRMMMMVWKLSFNLFYVMRKRERENFEVLSTALVQLIFYDNIKHCDKLNIFACTTLVSSHAHIALSLAE